MEQKKGFTLIEILLVVAIIAFLVAILVPSIGNVGADAKQKAIKADLNTLRAALETYRLNHGSYPFQTSWGTNLTSETNRLIDRMPADPYSAGGTGNYSYSLTGTTYAIYSLGVGGTGAINTATADTCTCTAGSPIYVTNAATLSGCN